jgi:hypothetical protein
MFRKQKGKWLISRGVPGVKRPVWPGEVNMAIKTAETKPTKSITWSSITAIYGSDMEQRETNDQRN